MKYQRRCLLSTVWGLAAFVTVLFAANPVQARNAGIASDGCAGCHRGGREPMVTVTSDPARVAPGATATLTIRIPAVNGPLAGFYLTSNDKGVFTDLPGQQTKKVTDTNVVHSAPRSASGGEVTFQVRWTAPAAPTGVDFDVWAVAANGDRARGGDAEDHTRLNLSVGCEGIDVYFDRDGDGYGVMDDRGKTRVCELGPGYSMMGGDCDDNSKDIHPGAPERCNFWDDNCDGKVNEGLEAVMVYRDADGDGYGARNTNDTRMGCGTGMGYSSTNDDCDDNNRDIRPGAMEICNNRDDNCNGRVDEGARATCGVGWCRRQATTCEPTTCRPGMPRPEVCNGLDDDCDGEVDNAADLCEPGEVCYRAECLTLAQAVDAGFSPGSPGRDGGAAADGPAGQSNGGAGGRATGGAGGGDEDPDRDPRPRQTPGCSTGGGVGGLGVIFLFGLVAIAARWRGGRRKA